MKLLYSAKYLMTALFLVSLAMASPAMAQECGLDNWDGDENDNLNTSEFSSALTEQDFYDSWDNDGDGFLSEEEWGVGVERFFGDYDPEAYGNFSEWDSDDDGTLTEDEFDNGLFDTVDDDDNDTINQDEWDLFDNEEDGLFC